MPSRALRNILLMGGRKSILSRPSCVFWTKAKGSGGVLVDGTGRHAIQHGSAAGADAGDPLWLPYLGTQYCYLPGSSGNYASSPDSAAISITGDIDLRAAVALDDWTPSADTGLIDKFETAGQQSYYLRVKATTGVLQYFWTADGNTNISKSSTVAPTVADGALLLVRVTHNVNNGAAGNDVKFWTKTSSPGSAHADLLDNSGWTQLGATVTTAGTTSIFNGNTELRLGQQAASDFFAGKYYEAAILNGIAGTLAFDADFSRAAEPFSTFTESSANNAVVTINRSATGRKSTVVDRDQLLFGVDDHLEIADAADLNFAHADSFTVVQVQRLYGLPTASATNYIAKRTGDTAANTGWALRSGLSSSNLVAQVADGTTLVTAQQAMVSGVMDLHALVRNVAVPNVSSYVGGSGTATADASANSLLNTEVMRIGRLSGAGTEYADFAWMGAAVFREALTAADLALVKAALLQ